MIANLINKVTKVVDLFPNQKTKTGALLILFTSALQVFGIDNIQIEALAKIAEALLAYGLLMKSVRK